MRKYYNLTISRLDLDLTTGQICKVFTDNKRVSLYEVLPTTVQFVDNSKEASNNDYHDFIGLLGNPIYDLDNWKNNITYSISNNIISIVQKNCDYNKSFAELDSENTHFTNYIFNLLKTHSEAINKLYINLRDFYCWNVPEEIQKYFEKEEDLNDD